MDYFRPSQEKEDKSCCGRVYLKSVVSYHSIALFLTTAQCRDNNCILSYRLTCETVGHPHILLPSPHLLAPPKKKSQGIGLTRITLYLFPIPLSNNSIQAKRAPFVTTRIKPTSLLLPNFFQKIQNTQCLIHIINSSLS